MVPLNPAFPAFPAARNAAIAKAAGLDLVLAQPDHATAELGTLLLSPDLDSLPCAGKSPALPAGAPGPRDIGYVLFTSGSTGSPKGVPIQHRSVDAYLSHVIDRYQLDVGARLSQTFELTFDLSVFDLFAAWFPSGMGAIPWHQISDTRLTDSLVARVDLSSGNLMLAGTAFDIAGAGDRLQLTDTFNSFGPLLNTVADQWALSYDRHLSTFYNNEIIYYEPTGGTEDFVEDSSGHYTTPAGYAQDLVGNSDGTFTLTDRKSGSKDTYDSSGTLTKVTDHNGATITVAQHSGGGYKLTEDRSGRWIDLAPSTSTQWKATDNTGRFEKFDTDGYGNLVKTTDTANQATAYAYTDDGSGTYALTKVTSPNGNVTKFHYDSRGNLDKATPPAPLGATTYTYDDLGRPHTATDGRGITTTYTYDARDRLTDVATSGTAADGAHVSYAYDSDGNQTSRTDTTGTTGPNATDGTLLHTLTDHTTHTATYDYQQHNYSYDSQNRLTHTDVSGLVGATVNFCYAAFGNNPANNTDPNGTFNLGAALAGGAVGALALAAGTILGGPVLGGAMGGCAGAAVAEEA